jgi:hypothetical protein
LPPAPRRQDGVYFAVFFKLHFNVVIIKTKIRGIPASGMGGSETPPVFWLTGFVVDTTGKKTG